MEVLKLSPRVRVIAVALGVALFAFGCALLGRGEPRFAFGHAVHVGDQALVCSSCHADAQVSDAPGMPDADTCAACHDELDAQKPAERQVASLFGDRGFVAEHALALDAEVVFSHVKHASQLACGECHAGVDANADVRELDPFTMDSCTQCHAQRKIANECSTCHTEVSRTWAPANHASDWTRAHGAVSRSLSDATSARCSLCHEESKCLQCHREEPPRSHTQQFRDRGHALLASLDRQNCAACHTSDSCDQCHREVTPKSHVGSFGGALSTHCLGCHFPLANEGCAACHKETPSHLSTPKPDDHTPVMICRQCHGFLAPLPHVDKGDDCNACHH